MAVLSPDNIPDSSTPIASGSAAPTIIFRSPVEEISYHGANVPQGKFSNHFAFFCKVSRLSSD